MNNDPFEEFEFKPLTEGLGFHKKSEQIKADKDSSRLAQDQVARTVPDRPPVTTQGGMSTPISANAGTTFTGTLNAPKAPSTPASDSISKIMSTLPPTFGAPGFDFLEENKKPLPSAATSPIPGARAGGATPITPSYQNAEFQSRLEESFAKAFPKSAVRTRSEADGFIEKEPAQGILTKASARAQSAVTPFTLANAFGATATAAAVSSDAAAYTGSGTRGRAATSTTGEPLFMRAASLQSAIVDGLAVLGISVLCLVIILTMTKADLVGLLANAQTDGAARLHLAVLFVVMLQLYMLVCRSFVGATLGEWAFDTQLGTRDEQRQAAFPLQVVARTLIVTATAFVLPVLSYFAGRDLLEPVTGLSLYAHDQESA